MDHKSHLPLFSPKNFLLSFLLLFSIFLFGFLTYFGNRYVLLRERLADTNTSLSETQNTLSIVQKKNASLSAELAQKSQETSNLQNQVEHALSSLSGVTNTVDQLKKLSQLDPELLKKYSRVYFLNENYRPAELVQINASSTFQSSRPEFILPQVWPYLEHLLADASDNGLTLKIVSAYRSFGEQTSLKDHYVQVFGKNAADQFSADQGFSEHQLGTTVDFTTPKVGASLEGFDQSPAYQWLLDNAYRYGFILSYPKGNEYYEFEPWHWRFVGVKLATTLHQNHEYFYDMDQRTIDSYLPDIFD
ncbi:MAG TPA: M15 family metallopeptidase [Candidatus Paceibacterota bacterium]|nr:M15 family metallopeptidase [Candidatus Paceibacterota bacterium]